MSAQRLLKSWLDPCPPGSSYPAYRGLSPCDYEQLRAAAAADAQLLRQQAQDLTQLRAELSSVRRALGAKEVELQVESLERGAQAEAADELRAAGAAFVVGAAKLGAEAREFKQRHAELERRVEQGAAIEAEAEAVEELCAAGSCASAGGAAELGAEAVEGRQRGREAEAPAEELPAASSCASAPGAAELGAEAQVYRGRSPLDFYDAYRGRSPLDFYDAVLSVSGLEDIYVPGKGWHVELKRAFDFAAPRDGVRVIPLGHFNSGKTWLIDQLSGAELPRGVTVHTEGICVKEASADKLLIIPLDTVGPNPPMDSRQSCAAACQASDGAEIVPEEEVRAQEDFSRQMCLELGQVIVVVYKDIVADHDNQYYQILTEHCMMKSMTRNAAAGQKSLAEDSHAKPNRVPWYEKLCDKFNALQAGVRMQGWVEWWRYCEVARGWLEALSSGLNLEQDTAVLLRGAITLLDMWTWTLAAQVALWEGKYGPSRDHGRGRRASKVAVHTEDLDFRRAAFATGGRWHKVEQTWRGGNPLRAADLSTRQLLHGCCAAGAVGLAGRLWITATGSTTPRDPQRVSSNNVLQSSGESEQRPSAGARSTFHNVPPCSTPLYSFLFQPRPFRCWHTILATRAGALAGCGTTAWQGAPPQSRDPPIGQQSEEQPVEPHTIAASACAMPVVDKVAGEVRPAGGCGQQDIGQLVRKVPRPRRRPDGPLAGAREGARRADVAADASMLVPPGTGDQCGHGPSGTAGLHPEPQLQASPGGAQDCCADDEPGGAPPRCAGRPQGGPSDEDLGWAGPAAAAPGAEVAAGGAPGSRTLGKPRTLPAPTRSARTAKLASELQGVTMEEIHHLEPAAKIDPDDAATLAEALWASTVGVQLRPAPILYEWDDEDTASADAFDELLLIRMNRFPRRLLNLLQEGPSLKRCSRALGSSWKIKMQRACFFVIVQPWQYEVVSRLLGDPWLAGSTRSGASIITSRSLEHLLEEALQACHPRERVWAKERTIIGRVSRTPGQGRSDAATAPRYFLPSVWGREDWSAWAEASAQVLPPHRRARLGVGVSSC